MAREGGPRGKCKTGQPRVPQLRTKGHSRSSPSRNPLDAFLDFEDTEQSKIFPNEAFGYRKVTVERPLRLEGIDPERAYTAKEIKSLRDARERSESAPPVIRKVHGKRVEPALLRGLFPATVKGKPAVVEYEPDSDLRDTEQVPLLEEGGVEAFLRREVLPYAPDVWYVLSSVRIGYEISCPRRSSTGRCGACRSS